MDNLKIIENVKLKDMSETYGNSKKNYKVQDIAIKYLADKNKREVI